MQPVLILGGYGNFGKRIAKALVKSGVPVIVVGRNMIKADAFKQALDSELVTTASFDAYRELDDALKRLKPGVVVNTCGPFQASDYSIPQACIRQGVHYVDLADGRGFVTGITALDKAAKEQGVAVISGASTVPALSSAVLECFKDEFADIEEMTYGISPGQKAERGLATTEGILSYVGKPLKPVPGQNRDIFGWQDIFRQSFPDIGKRWMANCDIPDLDLLPARYGVQSVRFSAGLELSILHLGLWVLSWLVRLGLPLRLPRFAKPMLTASNWFDRFGSADGGMFVRLKGKDQTGQPHCRKWFIIAFDGYGPHIPTVPAIILARKLSQGSLQTTGAIPCVGTVTLDEYLDELSEYPIRTYTE